MRVKGVTAIFLGLLGGLASLDAWAAQAPNDPVNTSGAAGPAAIRWHDRTRLAQAAESQAPAGNENPDARYSVDGLALGARVQSGAENFWAFRCGPSEQFARFTWCNRTTVQKAPRGEINASYSILHAADGTVVYANRTQEPAYFSAASAKEDVQRIAQQYGAQPRIIELPRRPGQPDGLIAVWGDAALTPVDDANMRLIAAGKGPKLGFLVDYISDFQRSAKTGLPVFRVGGGAGYVWAASFRPDGRGTLRTVAVDAAKFSPPGPGQAPVAAATPAPPAQREQAPSQAQSPAAQPQQIPPQAQAPAAPPQQAPPQAQSPPAARVSEPEPTVAQLKQVVQNLKADLANATAKVAALESSNAQARSAVADAEQARVDADNAKQRLEQTSLATRQALEAASAQRRFWQILTFVAGVGLVAALLAVWLGSRKTGASADQAINPQPVANVPVAEAEAAQTAPASAAVTEPAAAHDVLERELAQQVAQSNAARSEPARPAEQRAPDMPSRRSTPNDPPIFY
jgi:hypothetical protein